MTADSAAGAPDESLLATIPGVFRTTLTADNLGDRRRILEEATAAGMAALAESGLPHDTIRLRVGGGAHVDVHVVNNDGVPRPCVFYIHGGGLVAGAFGLSVPEVLDYARTLGAVVVGVDYRLAPEHAYPAGLDDCGAAFAWIFQDGADHGVVPVEVVAVGTSAGGCLAAGLALRHRDQGRTDIDHLVLRSPMLDDRRSWPSSREESAAGVWDARSNAFAWRSWLGSCTKIDEYAAPARARKLAGLPPTFMEIGTDDVFRDEAMMFASRLARQGVPVEMHLWARGFHGFENLVPDWPLSRAARGARLDYLARVAARPDEAAPTLSVG